jgi:sugar O-acyltransferase (sialic acid O-acetyltransferase NeuD family)
MNNDLYAVYGVSGCGRGVMPLARSQLRHNNIPDDRLIFVDDNPNAIGVNGQRVLTYDQFLTEPAQNRHVVLAIANSSIREQLALRCAKDGISTWSVSSANVEIMDDVQIGEGSILCPFVTVTSNIKIGKHFHANIYSYIEHDCVIGDYVTFAPAVKCNGNIRIENHAYIGTGAIIKQGKPGQPLIIGKGAVVGMGAVVTKNVPAGVTVVGNPSRPLVKD